jgi:hypothetical protein
VQEVDRRRARDSDAGDCRFWTLIAIDRHRSLLIATDDLESEMY